MTDGARRVAEIERGVFARTIDGREVIGLRARRSYGAPAAVWRALTDPEQVRGWFLPVSGELREGGRSGRKGTRAARSGAASRRTAWS